MDMLEHENTIKSIFMIEVSRFKWQIGIFGKMFILLSGNAA